MYFPTCVLLVVCFAIATGDKRLVLHSDLDISAELGKLESRIVQVETENSRLVTENNLLTTRMAQLENKHQTGAAVYVRWGRSVCPGNGTGLVHAGIIGGNLISSTGGASNSLCLADHPTWNIYVDGIEGWKSAIYGSEIDDNSLSMKAFGYDYHNQDPPCAVCHTSRAAVQMFPGRSNCYPGWTMEYTGYLIGGLQGHPTNMDYICLDSKPEELPHGLDSTSNNQHVLYFVEAHCGSLPCPPYHEGREIACVVCSK